MVGESIVLQFGESSNLSLVHFWNSLSRQGEYYRLEDEPAFNSKALLRNLSKESLTARSVIFENHQSSAQVDEKLVDQSMTVAPAQPSGWRKHEFSTFHPKSIIPLETPMASSINNVELFEIGKSEAAKADFQDAALDSIRFMAEECDSLESFIIVADCVGFWGGLSSEFTNVVCDEFGRLRVDKFGIFVECEDDNGKLRGCTADVALNLVRSIESSDCFYPLCLSPRIKVSVVEGCMMETFATTRLFPKFHGFNPKKENILPIGFGVASSGPVPQAQIHGLSVPGKFGSPKENFCIGRADSICPLKYPEYLDVSVYISEPEISSLRSVSSLMVFGAFESSSLRLELDNNILNPIKNQSLLKREFGLENSWAEVCENLENIIRPAIME